MNMDLDGIWKSILRNYYGDLLQSFVFHLNIKYWIIGI